MSDLEHPPKSSAAGNWISVIMVIVGFAACWLNWRSALEDGHYRPIAAMATPFLGFLGLAFLVVPPQQDQFIAKYGEAALGRRILRLRAAQVLGLLGIVAGVINFILMKNWF